MNTKDRMFRLAYIYLLALILIRFIPIIYPGSRTWGFNHLIFLPDIYSYCFFGISIIALIIPFLRFSEHAGERMAGWFSDKFLDGRQRYLFRLILIALMTTLFAVFTAPTHFLGDGYDVIQNIAAKSAVHVKWSEIGITKLLVFMASFLGAESSFTSRLAFQIVSVISGAISVYFIFLISKVVSKDRIKRLLVFIGLVFSGTLLLFFGYAEYYPIIWIFLTGFFYYSLLFLMNGKRLFLSWLFLLTGAALHVQLLVFLPALLFLSFSRDKGLNIYQRYKIPIWSLIFITMISAVLFFVHKYTTNLYIEDTFLPPFSGKPVDPGYAIFSFSHLLDIFNQFILLSPLLFLFFAYSGKNLKTVLSNKRSTFLALAAVGSIIFVMVIDPKLAFPRDWDLFSMSAFSLILLLITLINKNRLKYFGKLIIPFTLILFIYPLPFLLTNLNTGSSEKYIESLIELDTSKSMSSLTVLARYYKDINDRDKFDALMAKFNDKFLQDRIISQAMDAALTGDMESALNYNKLIKPDKFSGEYQRLLALLNYGSGNFDKALYHIDRAIQLRKFASDYHWTRSRILYSMKKYDMALTSLRETKQLDPLSLKTVDAMAMIFDLIDRPDSCVFYAKKTLELDSTRFKSYRYIVKWYAIAGQIEKANRYRSMYVKFSPADTIQQKNLLFLDSVITNRGR